MCVPFVSQNYFTFIIFDAVFIDKIIKMDEFDIQRGVEGVPHL